MIVKNKGVINLIKGSFLLSMASVVAKLLGAVYRIPLTNIIGFKGIGLYQMAFPIYSILLTFSSTGVPNSLARLISLGKNSDKTLYKSIKLFLLPSLIGFILMASFSYPISYLQGDGNAFLSYILLSPSVLIVSVISCYRGYFQGKNNMLPTATSQIIEQLTKTIFGLVLCYVFRSNLVLASGMLTLSVTISEVLALIYLKAYYKKKKAVDSSTLNLSSKEIIKTVLPITICSILIPFSRIVDSFLIINIIKGYSLDATLLYGIYSGGVESIIGVSVAVCYGVAVASIPNLTKLYNDNNIDEFNKKSRLSLFLTLALSVALVIFTYFLCGFAVNILYGRLNFANRIIMTNLVKTTCIVIVFLSLTQTANSILIARNKLYIPSVSLLFGIIAKISVEYCLLKVESINIFATAYSDIVCYGVSLILNLSYFKICNKKNQAQIRKIGEFI